MLVTYAVGLHLLRLERWPNVIYKLGLHKAGSNYMAILKSMPYPSLIIAPNMDQLYVKIYSMTNIMHKISLNIYNKMRVINSPTPNLC